MQPNTTRPVLGIGHLGRVGAFALVALVAAALSGFDPLPHVLHIVASLAGTDGIDFFFWNCQLPASLLLQSIGCNLLALGYLCIALHLAPIRVSRVALAVAVAWSLIHTSWLWLYLFRLPALELLAGSGPPFPWYVPIVVDALLEVPTAAVVLLLFHSRSLGLLVIGVTIGSSFVSVLVVPRTPIASVVELAPWQSVLTWHACTAALVLAWSGRRRYARWVAGPYGCLACGFDCRASSGCCPECGGQQSAA